MANINETNHWAEAIYEIATTDDVIGGTDGISNIQANQLAARTNFLKEHVTVLEAQVEDLETGKKPAGKAQQLAVARLISIQGDATGSANFDGTADITIRLTQKDNSFPAGTCMPFAQAAAPTGWTQINNDSTNNRMLRVVNGSGAGVGGMHSPVLNNVVPAHTHLFTTGHISTDHSHVVHDPGHSHAPQIGGQFMVSGAAGGVNSVSGSNSTYSGGYKTAASPSGISLSGVTSNHVHSGATDNGSSQTNWQPRYIDLIICVKN